MPIYDETKVGYRYSRENIPPKLVEAFAVVVFDVADYPAAAVCRRQSCPTSSRISRPTPGKLS